jgi:hypothetical protein
MTPKNRAELVAWLADLSSTENAQGREHRHALGDQFAERIVAALDAAGLAIVPLEPSSVDGDVGKLVAQVWLSVVMGSPLISDELRETARLRIIQLSGLDASPFKEPKP